VRVWYVGVGVLGYGRGGGSVWGKVSKREGSGGGWGGEEKGRSGKRKWGRGGGGVGLRRLKPFILSNIAVHCLLRENICIDALKKIPAPRLLSTPLHMKQAT